MEPKRSRWMLISLLLAFAMGVLLWPASLPASGQGTEWRVWMKASPCSASRQEWVSVATENPTYGGGGAFFEVFRGSHKWATFAEAMAEANRLRVMPCTFGTGETGTCPKFANYCCADYSVWQNSETLKYSVVTDKFGSAGFGWRLRKANLCCEDAYVLAGLPASCGGSACQTLRTIHQPESRDAAGRITVEASIIHVMNCTGAQIYIYQYLNRPGFRVIRPPDWGHPIGGQDLQTFEQAQEVAARAAQEGGSRGSSSGGGGGSGGRTASSGERPCTADERAAFAKMTGSFKSYRMNITIGGSCEQATGTYTIKEWCEGVDDPGSTLPKVTGTFKGRMNGGYLSVTYEQPASPNGHPARKGSGSCSLDSDGTFSCSGFGCQNKFKTQ